MRRPQSSPGPARTHNHFGRNIGNKKISTVKGSIQYIICCRFEIIAVDMNTMLEKPGGAGLKVSRTLGLRRCKKQNNCTVNIPRAKPTVCLIVGVVGDYGRSIPDLAT